MELLNSTLRHVCNSDLDFGQSSLIRKCNGVYCSTTVDLMWIFYNDSLTFFPQSCKKQTNLRNWTLYLAVCDGRGNRETTTDRRPLTLYGHIKTAEQRTIIQQYGDWYTGRWWMGCYIWYSEEGPGRAATLTLPSLLAVPNATAHPSTASVQTSYYLMWHYNCLRTLKG